MPRQSLLTFTAAALALAALAGPASAQTPARPLVGLERSTPVREYDGRLLFSRWTGSAYRLSTSHDGVVRDLPVRAQPEPFDADVGPDSSGRPSAVLSLCDADSCDLFVLGFDTGDELRPVGNANTRGSDETDPSIWRGRLVFAREYGRQVVAYTKQLSAPRSRPSDRLAGLPDKRCGAVDAPTCRAIERPTLAGMELWGRWVAQSWTYQPDGFPGFRQNEIRLTDVDRSDTRQIAAMTTGLAGQTYLGPSLVGGRAAFFRACQADGGGCNSANSGAIRYRISDRSYELAGRNEAWTAWAYDGVAGYHVPSDFDCSGGDPASPARERCGIYRSSDLNWRSVDEERIR
ncbi:MAG: hypothetical protein WKF42_08565 [Solirubrobacteraceae bacterium]